MNGAQQINFVTPRDVVIVRPDQTTSVVVSVNGVSSIAEQPPFASFQPALYLHDGTNAAVQHGSDYAPITAGDRAKSLSSTRFANLYQLNVRVPPGAQAGDRSVVISVQTASGPIVSPTILLPVGQLVS